MLYKNIFFAALAVSLLCFVSIASAEVSFASRYAKKASISETEAKQQLELVFDSIQEQLAEGEKVRLSKFGTFYLQHRDARTTRNPKTGKAIKIGARSYPKFRSSEVLKKSLRDFTPSK